MNRLEFLRELEKQLPEAFSNIDTSEELLHCEMAEFRGWVESQLQDGAEWNCQNAFEFIERCSAHADAALSNAIEVSFIYDLALGEHRPDYKKIVDERAPKKFRAKLAGVHSYWA